MKQVWINGPDRDVDLAIDELRARVVVIEIAVAELREEQARLRGVLAIADDAQACGNKAATRDDLGRSRGPGEPR